MSSFVSINSNRVAQHLAATVNLTPTRRVGNRHDRNQTETPLVHVFDTRLILAGSRGFTDNSLGVSIMPKSRKSVMT